MKESHPIYANPGNTVLVVVNMQNEFCKPGGGIHDERALEQMPQVISAISSLTQQARKTGIPIIHIQSLRTLEEPQFTVYGDTPVVKEGTWASEIVDELKPHEEDIVVEAWWHDPFYKTKLNHIVEGLVDDPTKSHAIVVGGDMVGCLYLTTMGFYLRNHWTVIPIDAVYGDQEGEEFALAQFSKSSLPSVFLTRSEMVEFSKVPETAVRGLTPYT